MRGQGCQIGPTRFQPDWAGNQIGPDLQPHGNPSCSVLQLGLPDWPGNLALSGNPDRGCLQVDLWDQIQHTVKHPGHYTIPPPPFSNTLTLNQNRISPPTLHIFKYA